MITRVLLGFSEFVMTQYLYYGPVVLFVGGVFIFWGYSEHGKRTRDWLRLKTPILRTMYINLYLTRMSRTMATLLGAGVSLLDIIEICRGGTNNVYYDRVWNDVARGVRDGHQISEMMQGVSFIPTNVCSMIAAGERSGKLSEVMERIAEFSEEELDASVKQTTARIEPIMNISMGFIIGTVAMALLLPVFSMGRVMSGG